MRTFFARLRDAFRRRSIARAFNEEMSFHVAELEREYRERGESPEAAALREVAEETGLHEIAVLARLGESDVLDGDTPVRTVWLHAELRGDAPDAWDHVVQGEGGDAGWVHPLRWLPLPLAEPLAPGHDAVVASLPDNDPERRTR